MIHSPSGLLGSEDTWLLIIFLSVRVKIVFKYSYWYKKDKNGGITPFWEKSHFRFITLLLFFLRATYFQGGKIICVCFWTFSSLGTSECNVRVGDWFPFAAKNSQTKNDTWVCVDLSVIAEVFPLTGSWVKALGVMKVMETAMSIH